MTDEWNIEKPQILISVTGGAKSFRLKPRLREMFANGLRKVLFSFNFRSKPLTFAGLFEVRWYHLYNLKNVKNTNGGVLLLVQPATLLKATPLHGCFYVF